MPLPAPLTKTPSIDLSIFIPKFPMPMHQAPLPVPSIAAAICFLIGALTIKFSIFEAAFIAHNVVAGEVTLPVGSPVHKITFVLVALAG